LADLRGGRSQYFADAYLRRACHIGPFHVWRRPALALRSAAGGLFAVLAVLLT
jgi:hypothetical protein